MCSVSIQVYYAKGIRVHIKNRTLREAFALVFQSRQFSHYDPLKIVFPETQKTLYADKQLFLNYLSGKITLENLVERTQCEELYRNTKDFETPEHYTIDAGSLWKLENKTLFLIDDDNVCTTKFEISIFEIAE